MKGISNEMVKRTLYETELIEAQSCCVKLIGYPDGNDIP